MDPNLNLSLDLTLDPTLDLYLDPNLTTVQIVKKIMLAASSVIDVIEIIFVIV